jgi:hypothetical protein
MTENKLTLAKLAAKDAEISSLATEVERLRTQLQNEREIHEGRLQVVAEELNDRG